MPSEPKQTALCHCPTAGQASLVPTAALRSRSNSTDPSPQTRREQNHLCRGQRAECGQHAPSLRVAFQLLSKQLAFCFQDRVPYHLCLSPNG